MPDIDHTPEPLPKESDGVRCVCHDLPHKYNDRQNILRFILI